MTQELTKTRVVKDWVLKALAVVDCNYMLFMSNKDISIFIDMPLYEVENAFRELFEVLEALRVQVEVHDLSITYKLTDEDNINLTDTANSKTTIFIYL